MLPPRNMAMVSCTSNRLQNDMGSSSSLIDSTQVSTVAAPGLMHGRGPEKGWISQEPSNRCAIADDGNPTCLHIRCRISIINKICVVDYLVISQLSSGWLSHL